MENKFKNKYRISSARLETWDYASEGTYFITICTHNRTHFFGEVEDGKMKLSPIGVIADLMWYEIKNHAKNLELGEFIVMPNHIHGILILNGNDDGDKRSDDGDRAAAAVETWHATSLPPSPSPESSKNAFMSSISPKSNSVSSIIGGYKSAVTKHAHRLGFEFEWQTRFHDHIIRNAQSFETIQSYIALNPEKWKEDKFYKNE